MRRLPSGARTAFLAFGLILAGLSRAERGECTTLLESDRMVVSRLNPPLGLFDATVFDLPEGGQGCDLCGRSGLDGYFSIFVGGEIGPIDDLRGAVILTQADTEPRVNGPTFLPGTDRIVSDVVFFAMLLDGRPWIQLVSEGDPYFASALSQALGLNAVAVDQTLDLQDLTPFLGTVAFNLGVEHAYSVTVIPEPGTLLLLATGIAALAAKQRGT